jgi:hypothetical protein
VSFSTCTGPDYLDTVLQLRPPFAWHQPPQFLETPMAIVTIPERGHGLAHLLQVAKEASVDHLLLQRPVETLGHAIGCGSATKAKFGARGMSSTRETRSGPQGLPALAEVSRLCATTPCRLKGVWPAFLCAESRLP